MAHRMDSDPPLVTEPQGTTLPVGSLTMDAVMEMSSASILATEGY